MSTLSKFSKYKNITQPPSEKISGKNTQSPQIQGKLVQKSAENASNKNLPTQKSNESSAFHVSQRNQSTNLQRKSIDWFP